MTGPLDGVRVLDLTSNFMGPYASLLLADMGADVAKIESPHGDTTRGVGPARHPGMSAIFLHLNRNKRSLVLDLKDSRARTALRRMIRSADVLLHSLRPPAMAKLGLAYADTKDINPVLIHCGCFGFGQDGPYADRPAYDDLIQAAVGMPVLQSRKQGEPDYVATAIADRVVGMAASSAIGMALFHRERTGRGQEVQVPMFETFAHFVMGDHLYGHTFVPPIGDWGYARMMNADRRPYRTLDGYLGVNIYTDRHWQRFFAAVGRPDLAADPRFADIHGRTELHPGRSRPRTGPTANGTRPAGRPGRTACRRPGLLTVRRPVGDLHQRPAPPHARLRRLPTVDLHGLRAAARGGRRCHRSVQTGEEPGTGASCRTSGARARRREGDDRQLRARGASRVPGPPARHGPLPALGSRRRLPRLRAGRHGTRAKARTGFRFRGRRVVRQGRRLGRLAAETGSQPDPDGAGQRRRAAPAPSLARRRHPAAGTSTYRVRRRPARGRARRARPGGRRGPPAPGRCAGGEQQLDTAGRRSVRDPVRKLRSVHTREGPGATAGRRPTSLGSRRPRETPNAAACCSPGRRSAARGSPRPRVSLQARSVRRLRGSAR